MTRLCPKCKTMKPLTSFTRDGRAFNYCADCRLKKTEYDRLWRIRLKAITCQMEQPVDLRHNTVNEYTGDDVLTFCRCRQLPDGRLALEIR